VSETFHWIDAPEAGRLAAMLHLPEERPAAGAPAALLCHGLTGHRSETKFLFVRLARRLAARGVAVLRFDFRGSGESTGTFDEMSLLTELADARCALGFLAKCEGVDASRIGVLGFSCGGAVAGRLVAEEKRVRALALWNAVAHVALLTGKFGEWGVGEGGGGSFPVDLQGLPLGERFVRDLEAMPDPVDGVRAFGGSVLVVNGTMDGTVPPSEAEAFAEAAGGRAERLVVKDGLHAFARLEHVEAVLDRTTDFFAEKL